jgi:hypothetical protein
VNPLTSTDPARCPQCGHQQTLVTRYCESCGFDRHQADGVAAPGGVTGIFRSARTRANLTVALLTAITLVYVLTAFHHASGFDLVRRADLGTLSAREATDFDEVTQILATAYLLAFLASAVAFLAWLSRSVDNVPPLTGSVPRSTPRWSIGWWFVPIANFAMPYLVVRDLLVRMRGADGGPVWIVLAWWAAWLGTTLASLVVASLRGPNTLDELNTWFSVNLAADLAGGTAAVLAIVVVRGIQSLADERATHPRAGIRRA